MVGFNRLLIFSYDFNKLFEIFVHNLATIIRFENTHDSMRSLLSEMEFVCRVKLEILPVISKFSSSKILHVISSSSKYNLASLCLNSCRLVTDTG